jgi:23S rRNA (guanosine2251-2'-O)-methyltransferase
VELDRMAGNAAHQGVVAVTSAKQYSDLDDVVGAKRGRYSFVIVLDGVEDPHNLGAVLRTADAAGADGVVIPERRAAPVTGTVTKASAGASEHLPIAKVTNIARTVEELKERNIWTVGLDERGPADLRRLDYNMDCALVLGAEGKGLHDLVKKKCDFLVSIPMLGKVPSLNVSVAGAVVMYEIVRQRRAHARIKKRGVRGCEMKLLCVRLCFLCFFCASVLNAFSLDREAFTFTSYDSMSASNPISSAWEFAARSLLETILPRAEDRRAADFVFSQLALHQGWRTSHCSLSPKPTLRYRSHRSAFRSHCYFAGAVAPKGTLEVEIAYEGVIVLDATRLTRIGAPETTARSTDWDQISSKFTAVRGAGYVAWYPIATEAAIFPRATAYLTRLGPMEDPRGRLRHALAGRSAERGC